MYTFFAERPIVPSIMLASIAAVCIVGWLNSGRKILFLPLLVSLLLIPGAWVLADRLVTDSERIEIVILEAAEEVETNDHDAVAKRIGPEQIRLRVLAELPNYRFETAKVTQFRKINLIKDSYPPAAEVELSVKVNVSEISGALQNVQVLRKLILRMEKTGSQPDGSPDWIVTDYSHMPITGDSDIYSNFQQ